MNCDNCMCKPPCEAGWLVLPSYNRSLSGDEMPKFPAFQPLILLNLEDTPDSVHHRFESKIATCIKDVSLSGHNIE